MSRKPDRHNPFEQDVRLVERCLEGDKSAWVELVTRYRRLIYSVPVKLGLPPELADEVFQDVCVKLLTRLDTLRDGRSLARWLIVTAQRRCWDLQAQARRYASDDEDRCETETDPSPAGDELVIEGERAHLVRQALTGLNKLCRELIEGLFYTDPPLSYVELGRRLGRPHGSLGPTRIRCLTALRKRLEQTGFR